MKKAEELEEYGYNDLPVYVPPNPVYNPPAPVYTPPVQAAPTPVYTPPVAAPVTQPVYTPPPLATTTAPPKTTTTPKAPTSSSSTTSTVPIDYRNPNPTPIQQYNYNNLAGALDKPLSAYDMYGSNYQLYPGVSTAAMMDPDVRAYFSGEYEGSGAFAKGIQDKINTMNNIYATKGWNGVLQTAKDYDVKEAYAGVDMANNNPNKKFSDGSSGWDDIAAVAALATAVFGGGAIASSLIGGAGGAAAGAGAAGAGAAEAGAGAAAAGAGAGSTAAGLGGIAAGIDASIPVVSVVGSAGAAGAGAGLGAAGAAAAAGAGAVGLGSMMGGGSTPTTPTQTPDPNIQQVNVVGHPGATAGTGVFDASAGTAGAILGAGAIGNIPVNTGGMTDPINPNVSVPDSSLPPLVPPVLNPLPTGSVTLPSDGVATNPGTGGLITGPISSVPNPNPSDSSGGTTLPGGVDWGSVIGGLGSIFSGYQDYQMNQADKDYYQGLMDKMMGMYNPGTPEATLMEQKMNAQDAAAGRNSQYGTRAVNLAGQLAQTKAGIMTSGTFGTLAQASRGHYDSSKAALSNLLGNATTSGTSTNNLINTGLGYLGSLFGKS